MKYSYLKRVLLSIFIVLLIIPEIGLNNISYASNVVNSINPNETYDFINNDQQNFRSVTISPQTNGTYDYAVYNSNGTGNSLAFNKSNSSSIVVPNGGKIVITSTGNASLSVTSDNTYFSFQLDQQQALAKVTLQPNDSYQWNSTDASMDYFGISVNSTSTYDYAVYNNTGAGNGSSSSLGQGNQSYSPLVPAGGSVVVTNTGQNPIVAYGFGRWFTYQASNPALAKVTLQPNDSYQWNSTDSAMDYFKISVNSTSTYDYAVYNNTGAGNGSSSSLGQGNQSYSPLVPAGGSVVVTNTGQNPIVAYGIGRWFTYQTSNPALAKVSLQPNDSYQWNSTDSSMDYFGISVNSASTYDYAIYDKTGSENGNSSSFGQGKSVL